VRRNDTAAARHVARDDDRIAGDVPAEMTGDQPCIGVIGATRSDRDDDRDCLAAVEVTLVERTRRLGEHQYQCRAAGWNRPPSAQPKPPHLSVPSIARSPSLGT